MSAPDAATAALGWLLGPESSEVGCEECFEQLDR
jgi:hypothetical protein